MTRLPNTNIEARWVFVTPDDARKMLSENRGNRRLSVNHVRLLSEDMENGRYCITGDTIKIDINGRLIDGQHRLNSICLSDKGQWCLIVTGLDPIVQTVIDNQKRRSAADAIHFAFDASNTTVVASVARLDLAIKSKKNNDVTALTNANAFSCSTSQVVEWVVDNPDVLDVAARAKLLATSKNSQIALPASAGGWLLLQFIRVSVTDAEQFFAPMLDRTLSFGSNQVEAKYDPRFTFMQTVNRMSLEDKRTFRVIVFGIHSWNLWRQGKELRLLKANVNQKDREPVALKLAAAV